MTVRTRKVSIKMPRASPAPIAWNWPALAPPPETISSTPKVPARTRPAEVTVGPVAPMALAIAWRSGR